MSCLMLLASCLTTDSSSSGYGGKGGGVCFGVWITWFGCCVVLIFIFLEKEKPL